MLTDFMVNHGYQFFVSGWVQFAAAFGISFIIMLLFGSSFIRWMHKIQGYGQPISENVPAEHRKKAGTPSMGGVLIIIAMLVASLLFMPMQNATGWIAISALLMFAAIGFADDYKKIKSQSKKASNGLSPAFRLGIEAIFVGILAYLINKTMPGYVPNLSIVLGSSIILPLDSWNLGFIFGVPLTLGFLYYVFAYFVICGSANATNITDGLDGMLSKLYLPVLIVLTVALYGATRIGFMDAVMF